MTTWLVLVLALSAARAETVSGAKLRSLRHLIDLKKITVGPDDQFQAAVEPGGKFIVFTHRADLVSHLRALDLASGTVSDVMPLTADSQDASFAEDGRLAFTYYKSNARGDICYGGRLHVGSGGRISPLSERAIECLRRPATDLGSERSSPFWVGAGELGYVVRDINTQTTRIVSENLRTHVLTTLAEGRVWAPAMRAGGHILVYNSVDDGNGARVLVVRDLARGETRRVTLRLPGVSGFAAVSSDEHDLYFSHFLNDTNQDNAIDGADNAVVFRLPLANVFAAATGAALFPEQLTSIEQSCSFPRPSGTSLFVTCAFENALDIYQLPASGTVPTDWTGAVIESAIRTSRSYGERILLLNTLKYRQPNLALDTRLLSNFILDDDTAAARYYLFGLQSSPTNRILRIYLEALELKKAQTLGEISRAFDARIRQFDVDIRRLKVEPRLSQLVRGHLAAFRGQGEAARRLFQGIRFHPRARTLERYLFASLAEALFTTPAKPEALREAYRAVLNAPELSGETRLFYAVKALEAIAAANPEPSTRLAVVARTAPGLSADARALFLSEADVLRVVLASGEPEKTRAFNQLEGELRAGTDRYFVRRAMNVRAIKNFGHFKEYKYLEAVAADWLRDTARTDTEFIYAREVVSSTALEEAYADFADKDFLRASGFFYSGLSLTDDLEAHAGFVEAMTLHGERTKLEGRYAYLVSHHMLDENMKYVTALIGIVDAEAAGPEDGDSTRAYEGAIKILGTMTDNRDSATRYLLLGYAHFQRLRRTANGAEFSGQDFEQAHRNLLLAFDQGRGNDRVRAAALINLGLLHQRAGNFGLSARYFALRKQIGFVSARERSSFAWAYARSLYHTYQYDLAARELAEVPSSERTPPILERLAFYTTLAGRYAEGAELYAQVLPYLKSEMNQARVQLAYGFALKKAHRDDAARVALEASLKSAAQLKPRRIQKERVLRFEPRRLQLIATGLLAQIGSNAERLAALKRRQTFLRDTEEIIDAWPAQRMLNELHIAEVADDAEAAAAMTRAIDIATRYAESNGFIGNAIYRTTIDYLALAWQHPTLYKRDPVRINGLVHRQLAAIERERPLPLQLAADRLKLILLWKAYRIRVLGQHEVLAEVLKMAEAPTVAREMPARYAELESLLKTLDGG